MTRQLREDGTLRHLVTLEGLGRERIERLLDRAQLVAKTERPGALAARAARALAAAAPAMRKAGLTVVVDVDPQSL